MNLDNYRINVSNLSTEEKIKRSKYLRDLAIGKIQGPTVNSPTLNMRQLAFYDEDEPLFIPEKMNFVKAFEENNADNLDAVALEFGMNKITYGEFVKNKNNLVRALIKNGITEENSIVTFLPGIPEAMYCTYATGHINSSGLIYAPYMDDKSLINDINKGDSKIMFVLDKFLENEAVIKKVQLVLDKTSVSRIVVVPALNSAFPKTISNKLIKKVDYGKRFVYYDDFINEGKDVLLPDIAPYKENHPAVVVCSSGSTGKLKGIMLSHDSLVFPPQTYKTLGMDLSRDQRFYQSIPLWSSTGLIALGTSPLYYGCTIYQNPDLDPKKFIKNIGKHNINWAVGTRDIFSTGVKELKDNKMFKIFNKLGKYNYNQLSHILVGGTPLTYKDQERLSDEFKKLGSKIDFESSYGTCENSAIVTLAGVPLPGVTIMIADDENNELGYNCRGKICIRSDFEMMDYFNRPDLSKNLYFHDVAGNRYLITGDIGYLTEDNKLVVLGREKDYSIINNKKVYNFDILNIVLDNDNVSECEVFSKTDEFNLSYLCCHIVLKNKDIDVNQLIKDIQNDVYSKLGDIDFVPEYFKFRDFFPIASSTKRDINKLKEEEYYIISDAKNAIENNVKKRVIE